MERRRAFVGYPSSILVHQQANRICMTSNASQFRRQRLRRAISMVAEEPGSERQLPTENVLTEDSQYLGIPEFIVDIGDDDIDDNVVDILGADFDVKTEKRKKVRRRTGEFLDEISVEPETILTSDADRQPPIDEDETTKYVRTAVRSADERKAADIVALRISKLTYISSFVVIATGRNVPQVRAIGNLVEEELAKKHGVHVRRKDGTASSGWLLLDYGDFMVNVFSPEQRENYNLEGLWKHGEEVDISDCVTGPGEADLEEKESAESLDDWLI